MEKWLSVAGYDGLYEVSNMGRLRSLGRTKNTLRRGGGYALMSYPARMMKLSTDKCGYLRATLTDEHGAHKCVYVHRLVCEAFHGPQPDGCEVAHGDNDRANAAASNLRWATRYENVWDKDRHGTMLRGESNPFSKLTEENVEAIRADRRTAKVIGNQYGISASWVGAIKSRKAWAHV
jgi:hypothetical protein